MNFIEAVKAMKEGKKVRVKDYEFSHYYELDEEDNLIGDNGIEQTFNVSLLNVEWEIVEEKIIPLSVRIFTLDKILVRVNGKEEVGDVAEPKLEYFKPKEVKEAVNKFREWVYEKLKPELLESEYKIAKEIFGDLVEKSE